MKNTAFIVMLTTMFALATAPALAAVKVFLLAGQSNMLGVGRASETPAPYKVPQTNVKYWKTDGTGTGEGWVNLRPRIVRDFFGPEVTFGYTLKHSIFPNDSIYLVKYAIGGTTSDQPIGNPTAPATATRASKSAIKAAMQNLANAHLSPSIAGMIWMQGEAEAHTGVGAPQYAAI